MLQQCRNNAVLTSCSGLVYVLTAAYMRVWVFLKLILFEESINSETFFRNPKKMRFPPPCTNVIL